MANWLNETKEFRSMSFHEQIRTKRTVDGFTQETLALHLGIPKVTLASVERCKMLLPRKHMLKMCAYLYGEEMGSVEKDWMKGA
ncbi:hypothetical protein CBR56_28985 [Bacillus thuringiensis]|uniref:helix-turn-helix domain-containing protein n=1 Tax=Bacillus tropicus TaxID=2026188 RepID=UPI000B43D8B8|nr:helix-turn-helix transcriptional regulator [Bacillus tropicus]MED3038586.1 helix-turn-helix transcriptional regulator [Bacillus tropicus]OTX91872.1 hypothetical protein BK728_00500 [Bacillus thuringiensis serovar chanpaisis]PNK22585.1 hypothetical protein CBR56_28985 [Bacillus thuringiensis]